jgi:hypothetical protein
MIKGYFNKEELKVYVDYYFNANGIDSCRTIGYFNIRTNEKTLLLEGFEDVFNEVVLESLGIDDLDYFTPPEKSPFSVIIPEKYQWAFPEDKFVLGGFVVPLETIGENKVVNTAYFLWQNFRNELDNGNHEDLKRSLMKLWDYYEEESSTILPWLQDPENNTLSDKVIIL